MRNASTHKTSENLIRSGNNVISNPIRKTIHAFDSGNMKNLLTGFQFEHKDKENDPINETNQPKNSKIETNKSISEQSNQLEKTEKRISNKNPVLNNFVGEFYNRKEINPFEKGKDRVREMELKRRIEDLEQLFLVSQLNKNDK